jgi:cobalt-zinc-cadmium resistance protein CzcA
MIDKIISLSIKNKLFVFMLVAGILGWGTYSLMHIPIDAVPDITNNQVQVITTSQNLSTQDIEQFITYPIELEMANLPGLIEMRSVSKFGLSVVTVVFEDEMGTYLPRQLIAEKIKTAVENIPEGFGTPEMGPISTGLGEIYQYVVDVKPGFENKYSVMELRTIQDWIIKRQLSGIAGVVEINTWGGQLKQFEVAINPEKLRAMNISIMEVFEALETNNSVTGAGYIEKNSQSYFIRGEGLVGSIADIENIVVVNIDNIPVYIRDIAQVQYGYAPRFGAITGNNQGEKVMGQVMLLKDANTNEVLERVVNRVAEIQKTLPEGVYINPFLERGELIAKTTFTVTENLLFGALIVIFIVVLLLGDWRAGLLIASLIPLSLLFAISLMNYFGISANLMSLGAIDFGIIIDGAIIIVEYVLYAMTLKREKLSRLSGNDLQLEKDNISQVYSSKMMRSAIFGQLIILIVFIPILTLSGVEGKMFIPMAITFSFALVGAMILSLTYVPAMAALFLKPQDPSPNSISNRIHGFIEKIYEPVFDFAMNSKKLVIGAALVFLGISFYTFSTMGGEFVPQLDEGDLVIQPNIPVGTSLEETIKIAGMIEKLLLEFDEVDQVVCRIGAAEVPTDPMNMEEIDVMIKLHPIADWQITDTKEGLIELMNEKLSILPGMEFEFTQPIEMRFNELITGVRSDVAIKLFGEDLDILANKGKEIKKLISGVAGAEDITLEKTAGLPQMLVKYNRNKVAQYGLNIKELNRIVQMNFSGIAAGVVYEGERHFDLVVRLDDEKRQDIDDLKNLFVELPNGNKIPLIEVADIDYTYGPAKISRDDAKRRIVVGINVRDRDMESVVHDIQEILSEQLNLPPGYYLSYGGQFENLEQAKSRLLTAVPIALILIFILLYIAFGTVKEALLVYTAIPLAATGGIWFLWLRDLPFSISAGVGFIALFGIATLNGIVLIEHFKELKERGEHSMKELIKIGTKQRIRPVLLTALAAALGFFPMAISASAGAEVQRPLATVVIGGLFTSTILTLLVLPILYYVFENVKLKTKRFKKTAVLIIGALVTSISLQAQTQPLSVDEIISVALENNPSIKAAKLKVDQSEAIKKSAVDFGNTNFGYNYGQINSEMMDYSFEVNQSFKFPTTYSSISKYREEEVKLSEINQKISKSELVLQIRSEYARLTYHNSLLEIYSHLDSNYIKLVAKEKRKYELGETKGLEYLTIESQGNKISLSTQQAAINKDNSAFRLQKLMVVDYLVDLPGSGLWKETIQISDSGSNAGLQYFKQSVVVASQAHKVQKNEFAPELSVGYFNQQIDGATGMDGVQVGVSIPLFYWAQKGVTQAAKINTDIVSQQLREYDIGLKNQINVALLNIKKQQVAVDYYESTGNALSERLLYASNQEYIKGSIGYIEFIATMKMAYDIKDKYLSSVYQYNLAVIQYNYLMGVYN